MPEMLMKLAITSGILVIVYFCLLMIFFGSDSEN